jgi:hypothetical protein
MTRLGFLAVYRLVYDASTAGFHTWKFALIPLGFVAFAIFVFLAFRNGPTARHRAYARLAVPMGVLGVLASLSFFFRARDGYRLVTGALRSGSYTVVEGPVADYIPEGPSGHQSESWRVGSHSYLLSAYISGEGFRQPGVVRSGDSVRIADVGGVIARLEIAR